MISVFLTTNIFSSLSSKAPTIYSNSYFGDGEGPIVWSYLSCFGVESTISQCSKSQYLYFSCSRYDVAGIFCKDGMCKLLSASNMYFASVVVLLIVTLSMLNSYPFKYPFYGSSVPFPYCLSYFPSCKRLNI